MAYAKANDIQLDLIDSTQAVFPMPPLWRRAMRSLGRLFQLLTLLATQKFSGAIVFCSSGLGFYEKATMCLMCRMFGVPSLLFVRSGHFMDDCRRSAWVAKVSRIFLMAPQRIGCQGDAWREFYRGLGVGKKAVVVRNWLSPEFCVPSRVRSKRVIASRVRFVYVGWLVEKKGVLDLIDAISDSEILRAAEVKLVGDGDLREDLENRILARGLENVELMGWKEPAQVREIVAGADVFVLPSHAEGFSNALLEAMSLGVPAIATDVGALSDAVLDGVNGFLIEKEDTTGLRKAMETMATNADMLGSFSEESLNTVQRRFDRDDNCRRLFGAL